MVTIITVVVMLAISITGIAIGMIITLQKTKKELEGKKVATILTASGDRFDKLLRIDGNQLIDPTLSNDGRLEMLPYLVHAGKGYDMWWPPGRPKALQVSVKSYIYAERNPEPLDPFGRPPVICSEILGNLQDINFSRAMVARSEEITGEDSGVRIKPKSKVLMYMMIGIAITLGIIAIYMVTKNGGETNTTNEVLSIMVTEQSRSMEAIKCLKI